MQDLSNYTREYYLRDQTFARHGVLRPDQLAALCYALNWPFWGFEVKMGEERDPGLIVSIGAGRGELEAELERIGNRVIGIDPTVGARALYRGTDLRPHWTPQLISEADTVIFCESIEHIPLDLTLELFASLTSGTRVVIVNFTEFFPIIPDPVGDGWDHITQVDDALYDRLAEGRITALRRTSHLVLDIP